jgi:hypothetical protein
MQLQNNQPVFRFSIFQKWWQNPQLAIEQYFPEELPKIKTKWMDAGSNIAEGLEERPLPWWLADIQPADISEYRIIEDFDGYLIRGSLDKFMYEGNTVIDNKALKRKMTMKEEKEMKAKFIYTLEDFSKLKNKFDEKDAKKYKEQLVFYQVLVEKRHGSVNPISYIEVIPMLEDFNGFIRRTGEPAYLVPVPVTDKERAEMKEKIINTAKDITVCWEAYKRKDIKI